MQYTTSANIVDVPNQLSFVYKILAPKLCVFIVPAVQSIKASTFIFQQEEKREFWADLFSRLSPRYTSPFLSRSPILPNVSSPYGGSLPLHVEEYIRYCTPQPPIALLDRLIPQRTQYMQYRQVTAYDTQTQSDHIQNLRLPVIQYDNCV